MKLLKDILFGTSLKHIEGNTNVAIESITINSREVQKNGLFIAIKGSQVDGHQYIANAIDAGAAAVICEELPDNIKMNVTYIQVSNSAEACGIIASNFYNNPSENLKLVGITGTNGKTTVATLAFRLFQNLGYKAGLLSTIAVEIDKTTYPTSHTTPNAIAINQWLAKMVEAGCDYAFMEVSSHAVDQHRISGLKFAVAGFTNITHDHLDYHGTFKSYINAKKGFFDKLSRDCTAIVNYDDPNGKIMVQNTKANVWSYALKYPATIKGKVIENSFSGMQLNINNQELHSPLIGRFNAYNLTAVYGIAKALKQDELQTLTALSILKPATGRFEYFKSETGVIIIVDYAHTPDALQNVLKTIEEIRTGNEEVITLVGCGGNRDKTKRPEMARIATMLSTRCILTSDNPRNENPSTIIEDMKVGVAPEDFKKYTTNPDRAEAIKQAFMEANPGDIVLIAGKGHETYQEVNGVKHDFDDLLIAQQTAKLLNK